MIDLCPAEVSMQNEYDDYKVGNKLIYVEFPMKATVEILDKWHEGTGEDEMVVFKIKFIKILHQYRASTPLEDGSECTIDRNLSFTGAVCGMWRFLPFDDEIDQAIAEDRVRKF
jgi:hypothetical protein